MTPLTVCFQKQRKELKGEAGSSGPVTPVKIPDCPVPASLLEELLRPPPAVSKEPLKNLNSCLQQLKYELRSVFCVTRSRKIDCRFNLEESFLLAGPHAQQRLSRPVPHGVTWAVGPCHLGRMA